MRPFGKLADFTFAVRRKADGCLQVVCVLNQFADVGQEAISRGYQLGVLDDLPGDDVQALRLGVVRHAAKLLLGQTQID